MFGCIEHAPAGDMFFILSVLIRAIEGAGFAGYFTSVLAIIVETFPQDPGYFVVSITCEFFSKSLTLITFSKGLTETVVTIGILYNLMVYVNVIDSDLIINRNGNGTAIGQLFVHYRRLFATIHNFWMLYALYRLRCNVLSSDARRWLC